MMKTLRTLAIVAAMVGGLTLSACSSNCCGSPGCCGCGGACQAGNACCAGCAAGTGCTCK